MSPWWCHLMGSLNTFCWGCYPEVFLPTTPLQTLQSKHHFPPWWLHTALLDVTLGPSVRLSIHLLSALPPPWDRAGGKEWLSTRSSRVTRCVSYSKLLKWVLSISSLFLFLGITFYVIRYLLKLIMYITAMLRRSWGRVGVYSHLGQSGRFQFNWKEARGRWAGVIRLMWVSSKEKDSLGLMDGDPQIWPHLFCPHLFSPQTISSTTSLVFLIFFFFSMGWFPYKIAL